MRKPEKIMIVDTRNWHYTILDNSKVFTAIVEGSKDLALEGEDCTPNSITWVISYQNEPERHADRLARARSFWNTVVSYFSIDDVNIEKIRDLALDLDDSRVAGFESVMPTLLDYIQQYVVNKVHETHNYYAVTRIERLRKSLGLE